MRYQGTVIKSKLKSSLRSDSWCLVKEAEEFVKNKMMEVMSSCNKPIVKNVLKALSTTRIQITKMHQTAFNRPLELGAVFFGLVPQWLTW